MTRKRRRYSTEFKFKVALDVAKGLKTLNELASEHSVHPNQISQREGNGRVGGDIPSPDRLTREHRDEVAGYNPPPAAKTTAVPAEANRVPVGA